MTVVTYPPVPTGVIHEYAGSTAPDGYLLCDGAAVSRTTYANLFAVLSTTYGAGDGSTTFDLPDMRGRMPLGAGTGTGLNASGTGAPSGTAQTARTRGQWGGEETHLLTTSEIPAHSHPVSDPGHFHTSSSPYKLAGGTGYNGWQVLDGNGSLVGPVTLNTDSKTTGITVSNNTGGGGRSSVMPPYVVLNYIIKI